MQFIQNGVKQLHTLLVDLKSYSEIENFEKITQKTNANSIAEKLVEAFKINPKYVKANISHSNLPTCNIFPKHFELILSNLISNGLKFNISSNPTVHIETMELELMKATKKKYLLFFND